MFASAIGLEPQTLVFATAGAIFGVGTTPPGGKFRSIALFFAVILGAALLGTMASDLWHGGSRIPRNVWSMALGLSFHLLVASTLNALPSVFTSLWQLVMKKVAARGEGEGDKQ